MNQTQYTSILFVTGKQPMVEREKAGLLYDTSVALSPPPKRRNTSILC